MTSFLNSESLKKKLIMPSIPKSYSALRMEGLECVLALNDAIENRNNSINKTRVLTEEHLAVLAQGRGASGVAATSSISTTFLSYQEVSVPLALQSLPPIKHCSCPCDHMEPC